MATPMCQGELQQQTTEEVEEEQVGSIQHHLHHHHLQRPQHLGNGDEAAGEEQKAVGLCDQLMLVSSLFAIEMCASFSQIYKILFLQFLGVPLVLVSSGSAIAGCVSTIFLPMLGVWADRGNNPKARLLFGIFAMMLLLVGGLSMLMGASIIKIRQLGDIVKDLYRYEHGTNISPPWLHADVTKDHKHMQQTYSANSNYTVKSVGAHFSNITEIKHAIDSIADVSDAGGGFIPIIIASIFGFAIIDVSFDCTVSITRALITESVPKFQNTQVHLLATIVQSAAGTSLSLVGCFDLPSVLGSTFQTDGTAVTLTFFTCILIIASIVGFCMVLIANHRLRRKKGSFMFSSHELFVPDPRKHINPIASSCPVEAYGTKGQPIEIHLQKMHEEQTGEYQDRPKKLPDIMPAKSARPLLLEDCLYANYSSINSGVGTSRLNGALPVTDFENTHKLVVDNGVNVNKHGNNITTTTTSNNNSNNNNGNNYGKLEVFTDPKYAESESHQISKPRSISEEITSLQTTRWCEKQTLFGSPDIPNSLGVSQGHSSTVTTPADSPGQASDSALFLLSRHLSGSNEYADKRKQFKKKLAIICLSSFFADGAVIATSMCSSTTLTLGILQGDPAALPGSEGRQNYDKGLQLGAVGNLLLYASFMAVSVGNTKAVAFIGVRGQYILLHLLMLAALLAVITSHTLEVYFLYMVCAGAFRTCMLTLSFLMAHKLTEEEMQADDAEPESKATYTGRVMTLVGCMITTHNILFSILVGPLMEVTGNPWVPLFYALGAVSASMGVLAMLHFA